MDIAFSPIIKKHLSQILNSNSPSLAYLFYGQSGVGKLKTAQWFAKGLVCQDPQVRPCGKCRYCYLIKSGNYPDLYLIEGLKNKRDIAIKQIIDLRQVLRKTPFANSFKIAIIKDAHKLNLESANALLKILEEPPNRTIFILLATDITSIPLTILSRTQIIRFQPVDKSDIISGLSEEYTLAQKEFIARLSQGRIGEAVGLNKELIKQRVEIEKELLRILESPIFARISFIEKIAKEENEKLIYYLVILLRDALLIKLGLTEQIAHYYKGFWGQLKNIAETHSLHIIKETLDEAMQFPLELRKNINPQLLWQNLLLKI